MKERLQRLRMSPDAALLRQAELRAEMMVSVLRIFVSFGLLIAFLVIVGDDAEKSGILRHQGGFVMLSLLSYLMIGVLSLWAARKGLFRAWMTWPMVTLDCLFVIVNTWVGLVSSGLPGELTFLLPPTWLVPTVLAFTLLRFNPYLQAYCVVLLVAGFGWLVFNVEMDDPVQAMARAKFLVKDPANVVRLVMISLGGVVLVAAALALRSILHRALIETENRLTLTRYLPARLAERLGAEDLTSLRQGARQEMGVLFVDIRGFTTWAETRDPTEVSAFITEFRIRVQKAARETGGMVDKFIGDGAMLLFEGADAAARALQCSLRLSDETRDWSVARVAEGRSPVHVGVGLHWGEVFSGVVGDEDRLEYTALGDTVNTAARLEQMTKDCGMEIVVSACALDAAEEGAARAPAREGWTALEPVFLRGRSQPVAVFGRREGTRPEG